VRELVDRLGVFADRVERAVSPQPAMLGIDAPMTSRPREEQTM
jgi:hypothetical protein